MRAGEHLQDAYRAINPMAKVPAIRHGEALVTEQAAVYLYLADLFPEAGLAPAATDPARAAYLRWMVFYGSCFEPALVDRSMQREPAPHMSSPYGTWQEVLDTIVAQLTPGPWLLGERFSAADVLWGTALHWTTMFKLVPDEPPVRDYIARVRARPAMQRAEAKDEAILAKRA